RSGVQFKVEATPARTPRSSCYLGLSKLCRIALARRRSSPNKREGSLMSHKLSCVGTACAVVCSLTLILRMGASADADVIVGAPGNSANAFPFVVYNGGMTSEYQQAYAAADFSGPITITGLSFFAAPQIGDGTVTIQGTYTISLAYSANPVGSLSTTFANNIGANFTTIFSGQSTQSGVNITFPASTPFTYDPSMGPLLLDVVASTGDPHSGARGLTWRFQVASACSSTDARTLWVW